jgi:hypothetical protein
MILLSSNIRIVFSQHYGLSGLLPTPLMGGTSCITILLQIMSMKPLTSLRTGPAMDGP